MITNATFENYKLFKNVQLSDLSRITLLGGGNNVGKSSVLEALFLFYDRGNPNMFFRPFAWRGITSLTATPELSWAPLFRNYAIKRKIAITVVNGGYKEVMEIQFDPSYTQKSIEIQIQPADEANVQLKTDQQPLLSYTMNITYKAQNRITQKAHLTLRYNADGIKLQLEPETAMEAINVPATFIATRFSSNELEDAARFSVLDTEGQEGKIVDFLKIIEPKLRSLSVSALGQPTIQGDVQIGRKLSVSLMGDGTRRLLSIILAIATTKNGIVFVDEIENGIHYSAMPSVWEGISRAATEFNCQIIATTHSYECLEGAYEGASRAGIPGEFSYIRLDRTDKDIVTQTYSHEILGAALSRGWEVR